MSDRFSVNLWRIGSQTHVTMAEYDKQHKLTYRITYPITYAEACDLGHWATQRSLKHLCDFYLGGDGWTVMMSIPSVINPDVKFHPLHSCNRLDAKNSAQYAELCDLHYSHLYVNES